MCPHWDPLEIWSLCPACSCCCSSFLHLRHGAVRKEDQVSSIEKWRQTFHFVWGRLNVVVTIPTHVVIVCLIRSQSVFRAFWVHLYLYFHTVRHYPIAIQSPKAHFNARCKGWDRKRARGWGRETEEGSDEFVCIDESNINEGIHSSDYAKIR